MPLAPAAAAGAAPVGSAPPRAGAAPVGAPGNPITGSSSGLAARPEDLDRSNDGNQ
ncbi:MAG TPA: hypothetical protein VES67_26725 [Vicinamibacterales bacterium]|nr:hypothetical protein [Vicinamibacterales bacterium]